MGMEWLVALAILPEGSVRNEGVFFALVAGLAILAGLALYLRHKRNKQPDWPTE
jgi:LPXTG-motif cell wall-anchored protein